MAEGRGLTADGERQSHGNRRLPSAVSRPPIAY